MNAAERLTADYLRFQYYAATGVITNSNRMVTTQQRPWDHGHEHQGQAGGDGAQDRDPLEDSSLW